VLRHLSLLYVLPLTEDRDRPTISRNPEPGKRHRWLVILGRTSRSSGGVSRQLGHWQRRGCAHSICIVAADAFLTCRVTQETKALVRTLAQRDGVTESALVKQLLEVLLRSRSLSTPLALTPPEPSSRNARLSVRLQLEDWRLLRERADARRIPAATYVSHLVRSHLRGVTPLPKTEFLALKSAVAELAAIGRNLNQIARVLNQGGRAAMPGQPEVGAMLKVAVSLRDHFRGLLTANERSWTSS